MDYTNDVSERLLKRVELKKEKIYYFVGSKPYNDLLLTEQMRFILSILEISYIYNDLRFLNAALKANDRVYYYLKNLKISEKKTNESLNKFLLAMQYIFGIKMQEDLYNAAI